MAGAPVPGAQSTLACNLQATYHIATLAVLLTADIMGSSDVPPDHVPSFVMPLSNNLLRSGGALWTLCYVLSIRDSFRAKSYAMPLGVVAMNFAW